MLGLTNHWDMQIKTTMRCQLRPLRMTAMKKKEKKQKISAGEDVEKLEP